MLAMLASVEQVWSLFLSPSESDVRQWQGAASEARPSLRWVVFVCGRGDGSAAHADNAGQFRRPDVGVC